MYIMHQNFHTDIKTRASEARIKHLMRRQTKALTSDYSPSPSCSESDRGAHAEPGAGFNVAHKRAAAALSKYFSPALNSSVKEQDKAWRPFVKSAVKAFPFGQRGNVELQSLLQAAATNKVAASSGRIPTEFEASDSELVLKYRKVFNEHLSGKSCPTLAS